MQGLFTCIYDQNFVFLYPINLVVDVYYDNIGVTQLSSNPVFQYSPMKHVVVVDYHFLRDQA
jgi:hypothetical protein